MVHTVDYLNEVATQYVNLLCFFFDELEGSLKNLLLLVVDWLFLLRRSSRGVPTRRMGTRCRCDVYVVYEVFLDVSRITLIPVASICLTKGSSAVKSSGG